MRRPIRVFAAFPGISVVLFCLFPASVLYPQGTTGELSGIVIDSSSAAVPLASVTITNMATGANQAYVSDENGRYVFPFVPSGTYQVEVQREGFSKFKQTGVLIQLGVSVRLDMTLKLGEVSNVVEVSGQSPLLQAINASVGQVISEKPIKELPLNGRNPFSLINLVPGSAGNDGSGVQSSINGSRIQGNKVLVDGVQINQEYSGFTGGGGVVFVPQLDSISEFNVITNNFSAEYGRVLGGVVSVNLKSGTNHLHGTAFDFWRNDVLQAKSFFNTQGPKPRFNQHQFGGAVGGPIKRDKLFFFGDYEGTRSVAPAESLLTLPTAKMRQGEFTELPFGIFDPLTSQQVDPVTVTREPFPGNVIPSGRLNQTALNSVRFYPETNRSGITANYFSSRANRNIFDKSTGKLDYNVSNSDRLYLRFTGQNVFGVNGPLFPGGNIANPGLGDNDDKNRSMQFNQTHTFTPGLINEFRFGFIRETRDLLTPRGDEYLGGEIGIPKNNDRSFGFPVMAMAGYQQLGFELPNVMFSQRTLQWDDTASYIRGRHSMKFGVQARRLVGSDLINNRSAGTYSFSGGFTNQPSLRGVRTGDSMADFMLGMTGSFVQIRADGPTEVTTTEVGLFFQDDFRFGQRLTLNGGIRWDYLGCPFEGNGRITSYDPDTNTINQKNPPCTPTRKLFAPRIGFAYLLTPKFVIRGGYGISYFPQMQGVTGNFVSPPYITQLNIPFTGSFLESFRQPVIRLGATPSSFPAIRTPFTPTTSLFAARFLDQIATPYMQMWNLTLQREFWNKLSVDVGYLGEVGSHLDYGFGTSRNQLRPDQVGPDELFGGKTPQQRLPFPLIGGFTQYDNLGHSTYHGLQMKAQWQYTQGLWFLASYTYSKSLSDRSGRGSAGNGFRGNIKDWENLRLNKGPDAYNLKQNLVFSFGYELPFGPGKRFLNRRGAIGNVLGGWQTTGIFTLRPGFPFTVTNSLGGQGYPNRRCDGALPGSERGLDHWFDTGCFNNPNPIWKLGDSGVDIINGPGLANLDFSLFKRFLIQEKKSLEFRSDFFNLTNTPHFGIPAASLGATGFGRITSVSGNRIIQLAARFSF